MGRLNKWALITGASSGIGREFSKILASKGYSLILVARRIDRLETLRNDLLNKYPIEIEIIGVDLANVKEVKDLYKYAGVKDIEILINNAGFGYLGNFDETDLDREMSMIDINIRAVHILTKLFIQDFLNRDTGYILNVASSAGLMPAGPYMATYYATKSYVTSLTSAIAGELRARKSRVYIASLCPGPVDTEFNDVANCKFSLRGISPEFCARYAIDSMFKEREIIIPSLKMKLAVFFSRFMPRKSLVDICGNQQSKKMD